MDNSLFFYDLLSSQDKINNLCKAVVIRSIKDYQYPQYKNDVIEWVVNMEGLFPFCADALGVSPTYLREIMVDKMIQIDTYGTVTLYINGESRMRK